MTDTKAAAQPQADDLPEPLDDAEPAAPAVAERTEATEEAAPRVTPVETQPFADARERIAQLYRDRANATKPMLPWRWQTSRQPGKPQSLRIWLDSISRGSSTSRSSSTAASR